MTRRQRGDDGARGPQRRCIASGDVLDKARLVRFVVGPDGTVVPDPGEDLPGRGLWLRPDPDMIETARRRRLFARAARAPVTVPDDLGDRVAGLLRRRCLDRLGLARAAGDAVAGFDKVRALVQRGAAGVLLQACDAAPDGRGKVRRLAAATRPDLPLLDWFGADELGRALGRTHAVHVAVRDGGHARRLMAEAARLSGFLGPIGTADPTRAGREPDDATDRDDVPDQGDATDQDDAVGRDETTRDGTAPDETAPDETTPDDETPNDEMVATGRERARAGHGTHEDERSDRAPERHDDE